MKNIIAAFDFDGTITYRDSLFPFILYCFGYLKSFFYFIRLIPVFLRFLCGLASRQETKEAILTQFFKGVPIEQMLSWGSSFAQNDLPRRIRPKAKERIEWHQRKGHRCLLVSASIEIYLEPWATLSGFEKALTSRLEIKDGKVTGKLLGLNCRREEKIRRLEEYLGDLSQYTIYAYGDSKGDYELLEKANYSYFKPFVTY